MKISKSKQELARIISENGGWQEYCEWAVQDKSGEFGENAVILFGGQDRPIIEAGMSEWMCAEGYESDSTLGKHVCNADKLVKNWHQTILSRDEYFHLYPAQVVEPEFCESVTRSIPEPEAKPTIEQLAADYRAKLAIAQQAQEEADLHRCGAEAALEKLVDAGNALGLVLSVAAPEPGPEPELVITDWRDLQVGDEVEASYRGGERLVGPVLKIDVGDNVQPIFVSDGARSIWATEFRFIRRP